jgi:putative ABC transport system permease protein
LAFYSFCFDIMVKNYILTALRNLRANRTNGFLNIFGLAIGIVCAGLIFLWVEDELKFDSNHLKKDRLYLVKINAKVDNGMFTHSSTPAPLGPAMLADMPGVANTCRTTEEPMPVLFNSGDRPVYADGLYTDPTIFSLFTLPFVQGNAQTAFTQLYSLVITEKTAKKFFGQTGNVVGKTIRVDNKQDYVITGVLKDLPENSTLQFEWLASFQLFLNQAPWAVKWGNFGTRTFAELKPGVNPAVINGQLHDYIQKKLGDQKFGSRAFLFSMNGWRLYDQFDNGVLTGSGRIAYVRLFSLVAWIILLIACINFMNLATAQSEKRAREVGVRKVLGAGRKGLFVQFIGEAILMTALAGFCAVILLAMLLPAFNGLVEKNLRLALFEPSHIGALLLITLLCGLVAGSYPALYLSSFRPIMVLKGIKLKTGSAALIRKTLVVLQFATSIVLIIGTIIIYQQTQHVKSRDLGFRKDNLVQMNLQGNMLQNFDVIRQDLLHTGLVENATLADHETIYSGNNTTAIIWPGKQPGSQVVISQRLVDQEYFSTLGMTIKEGRGFYVTDRRMVNSADTPGTRALPTEFPVLVTETMEKVIGQGSAVGKSLTYPGNGHTFNLKVVGVVHDYVYGDMYGHPDPVVFYCLPQQASLMYVRIKPGVADEQVLAKMGEIMKKDNPSFPFEYKFVDDQFNELFSDEMLMSRLSGVFASLAILISCLGLFGLAAYMAERRTKEIGIRKVLGASATGLAGLLSKDFVRLVLIACAIAFPVAWLTMQNWLKGYNYRIEIQWWIFAVAGATAILIALATVSVQAFKVALANPVKSMRAE